MNDELLSIAEEKDYFIPSSHLLMPVNAKFMDNDNVKYHETHNWNPDYRAWEMAKQALRTIYEPIYSDFKPIDFDRCLQLAEKNTSAGYLYKKLKLPKKKDVFNKAYELLKMMFNQILSGENVKTIFEMAPKVEIRDIEKIISMDLTKRKQRTFVVSDVLHYIVGISLYHNFNSNIVKTAQRADSWNGVGISIFKGGWHQLAADLLQADNKFYCFDEKAMESCVTIAIQEAIYSIRHEFITGEYHNAATWYATNVMVSFVVDHRGNFWIKIGQNPSGHHNTLVDNGHAEELKGLYHLAKNCYDVAELIEKYKKSHKKIVGDDTIIPVSPFNYGNIWDGYLESSHDLGFNTTEETEGATDIFNVKFLNFGFIWNVSAFQFTFKPNYDKLFANLFFYRKQNSWRLTLAKLFAMKVLCYNDFDKYMQVCNYISYVLSDHYGELLNEKDLDDILDMNALLSQNKNRDEIRYLIFNLD